MKILIDNWELGIAIICMVCCVVETAICFFLEPRDKKVANVKQWLKWAVTEAEKDLGHGTGQLKLRKVYDMAMKQFPWLITLVSFDTFSDWVDEALEWMKLQLEFNKNAKDYVEGE